MVRSKRDMEEAVKHEKGHGRRLNRERTWRRLNRERTWKRRLEAVRRRKGHGRGG